MHTYIAHVGDMWLGVDATLVSSAFYVKTYSGQFSLDSKPANHHRLHKSKRINNDSIDI